MAIFDKIMVFYLIPVVINIPGILLKYLIVRIIKRKELHEMDIVTISCSFVIPVLIEPDHLTSSAPMSMAAPWMRG